jgi:hypothetical protein
LAPGRRRQAAALPRRRHLRGAARRRDAPAQGAVGRARRGGVRALQPRRGTQGRPQAEDGAVPLDPGRIRRLQRPCQAQRRFRQPVVEPQGAPSAELCRRQGRHHRHRDARRRHHDVELLFERDAPPRGRGRPLSVRRGPGPRADEGGRAGPVHRPLPRAGRQRRRDRHRHRPATDVGRRGRHACDRPGRQRDPHVPLPRGRLLHAARRLDGRHRRPQRGHLLLRLLSQHPVAPFRLARRRLRQAVRGVPAGARPEKARRPIRPDAADVPLGPHRAALRVALSRGAEEERARLHPDPARQQHLLRRLDREARHARRRGGASC